MIKLYQLIVTSAEKGLELQKEDGSMPPGHNGPWKNPETPLRNTSHWLMIFLKAFKITEDNKFRNGANKCANYIKSDEARPKNYTFHHRIGNSHNKCNGLIGQAWTIESLFYASKILDDPELAEIAEEVFLLHPFNQDFGIWKSVEIDGSVLFYDMTLNHQIWFAAAGSMSDNPIITEKINIFLDNIDSNISLDESGLVKHPISRKLNSKDLLNSFKSKDNFRLFFGRLKHIIEDSVNLNSELNDLKIKCVGYHSFNTYGLALLKNHFGEHDFWESKKMQKILEYSNSERYAKELEQNKYGFPYNPPGLENAYTLHTFEKNEAEERKWVEKQLDRTFHYEDSLMNRKDVVSDANTYAARIYEAVRLPNYNLNVEEH